MNPLTTDRLDIVPANGTPLVPGRYLRRGEPVQDINSPGVERYGNVGVGTGAGGSILSWLHDGEELINVAGWFGRAMQQTLFLQKQGVGVVANPTMAGDMYGDYVPGHRPTQIPPKTWDVSTFVCGARMLDLEVTGQGDQLHIRTFGIPLEWDPAGDWFGTPQRGSMFNRLEYRNIRFGFDIDTNWQRPGIHRVRSSCWLIEDIPEGIALTWVPHEFYMRFGFDEVVSYGNGGYQTLSSTLIPGPESLTFADLSRKATYLCWTDRLEIADPRPIGDSIAGNYPGVDLFAPGGNAVMYSCWPLSTNPWSFKKDLAVAWYSTEVTGRADVINGVRQKSVCLRWLNPRGPQEPTNGIRDMPCMVVSDRHAWDYHAPNPPPGLLVSTAFLLIGTYQEVQDNITHLESLSSLQPTAP